MTGELVLAGTDSWHVMMFAKIAQVSVQFLHPLFVRLDPFALQSFIEPLPPHLLMSLFCFGLLSDGRTFSTSGRLLVCDVLASLLGTLFGSFIFSARGFSVLRLLLFLSVFVDFRIFDAFELEFSSA